MNARLLILIAMIMVAAAQLTSAAEPLDFNRDIRPILSQNCFACHGLDEAHREADLRLDTPEGAFRDLGGHVAVAPGDPARSGLIERIHATDPELMMPPPRSHKQLTDEQKELLNRWIAEGAPYAKHWAFIPPQRADTPADREAIDVLIQRRLNAAGLSMSPPAAPEAWLRRVTLDLTGLPPTVAELDAFLQAVPLHGEAAYAAAVDRLLASPRLGERLAQDWLDASRYADTHGFNNDSSRSMWRWRDWVIDAFNNNMPYNQFITEQLAGDLLPEPSLDQRIATGFCRNHVINSEGGIIDEEYRVEYVADRVRTMSTAWLGLTMECSRCHNHKFDPVTIQDYYSLFAFFNNVPEHGEDGRVANAVPLIAAPTRAQQAEHARLQQLTTQRIAQLSADWQRFVAPSQTADNRPDGSRFSATAVAVDSNAASTGNRLVAALPDSTPVVTVEIPSAASVTEPNATPVVQLDCDTAEPVSGLFQFAGSPPTIVPGVRGNAWQQLEGTHPLAVIAADKIHFNKPLTVSFWVKPDPANPADVALLSNVSYSGERSQQGYGHGQEIRLVAGELEVRINDFFPAYTVRVRTSGVQLRPDAWHHIVVTNGDKKQADQVRIFVNGLEQSKHVIYDDVPYSCSIPASEFALGSERTPGAPVFRGAFDDFRVYEGNFSAETVFDLFRRTALPYMAADDSVATPPATTERPAAEAVTGVTRLAVTSPKLQRFAAGFTASEAGYVLGVIVETPLAGAEPLAANELIERITERVALERSFPTTMVMQELPEPRTTRVLRRGRYDDPGDVVPASVPESVIAPWPTGAPRDRLGLAAWLTQPEHPLTARVVVNRYWAQFFGQGLVRTLEDFGAQGDYPSHPELLDTLARDFVDGGWNLKGLLRRIVLSATYRQDSRVPPTAAAADPENRLLARGPRVRLSAETLRDQALALSGLLAEQIGGPSVRPYQPEGLYVGLVVGADYPGTKWEVSEGADRYRRSLYTFWKRTVPHPVMVTFDAPDREFCMVRRGRTNTPLQALILLNEPAFVEASRRLGEQIAGLPLPDDAARIASGFRQVTSRRPTAAEQAQLIEALDQARTAGDAEPWHVIGAILLNLDETVTRE